MIAARDHSEGWHYLQKYQFDVLLADVSSPQQCADELVQRCLSMPKAHRPQHVIPLGLGVDNSPFKSAAMGFSIKPANLSTLLDTFRGPLN